MSVPSLGRLYRPVPGTSTKKGETRTLTERRPIYLTPEGRRLPTFRSYGVTATGAFIVALDDYERVRDRLCLTYGAVEVIHDDLVYPDEDFEGSCWPQCLGATSAPWWACECPCGGSNHGGVDHLMGYTLEGTAPAGEHIRVLPDGTTKTYAVKRRTFTYRNPALGGAGGHLHAV
jgi:hypothetical protein